MISEIMGINTAGTMLMLLTSGEGWWYIRCRSCYTDLYYWKTGIPRKIRYYNI